jgi:hypothetical protein
MIQADVDGVLVGGASLKPRASSRIVNYREELGRRDGPPLGQRSACDGGTHCHDPPAGTLAPPLRSAPVMRVTLFECRQRSLRWGLLLPADMDAPDWGGIELETARGLPARGGRGGGPAHPRRRLDRGRAPAAGFPAATRGAD